MALGKWEGQRVPSKTLFLWSSVWQEDCTEVQNIKISSANSMLYLQGSYHGQWQWWEYRKSQLPHVQIRGKKLAESFSIIHSLETMHQTDIGRLRCWRMNILSSKKNTIIFSVPQVLDVKLPNPTVKIRAEMKWRFRNRAWFLHMFLDLLWIDVPKWESGHQTERRNRGMTV